MRKMPQSSYIDPSHVEQAFSGQQDDPIPSEFALEKLLGKSEHGMVFLVTYLPDASRYIMKVVNKKALRLAVNTSRQIKDRRILSKDGSPFIVNRAFRFDVSDKLIECIEYVEGIDLSQRLAMGKLDEEVAKFYAAEVLLGLNWLHTKGITYRELMPQNVLIGMDGHIKLSDFGISRLDGSLTLNMILPRIEYVAPEVIEREILDIPMDYWGLGVLIYEMLAGCAPIQDDADNKRAYLKTLKQSKVTMKYWFSPEASNLISRLLQTDPDKRLVTFSEVKSHPFFSGIDWEAILHREVSPPTSASVQMSELTPDISDTSFIMNAEFESMLSLGFTFKIESILLKSV
eukprot:CAMPEP_0204897376 /NCGR_PEP_ID=MMETSP1397-20131031/703_1 /ASSEMBLY_ACC=CAM_ASM_000891 /TAXON_ID=49980 /ORGANISM="Climacostomum Climacostomum virens, Strain Stock W-24" /LENGTH=344 /DNA_ID=CAMNT_0052065113 /DNA_START=118 /DNA_END=1148 /DNA_ORIENTATION=-